MAPEAIRLWRPEPYGRFDWIEFEVWRLEPQQSGVGDIVRSSGACGRGGGLTRDRQANDVAKDVARANSHLIVPKINI